MAQLTQHIQNRSVGTLPTGQTIKIMKRCPMCGWRVFDKVTPTSGIIEMKCSNCRKIVEIDLSYRKASNS